jgi:hypothetical protein
MLPKALSDVLGVSLSEVLAKYYSGSDVGERGRLIGDALDRKQSEEEGEEWLAEEACKRDVVAELVHRGEMIPTRVGSCSWNKGDLLTGFLFDWCP